MIPTQQNKHKQIRLFLFLLFFIHALPAIAQEEVSAVSVFRDDLLMTEVNPLHAFGIFTLNTPYYFGSYKSKGNKFSMGYSFGNTWHPQSTVVYPINMTPAQQQEVNSLYITKRPDYFIQNGIAIEKKTFSTDGVLQNLNFTWLLEMAGKGSLIFKLNSHLLSGGSSGIHYLTSDLFIEKFHRFVGLDNFGRKYYEFNKAHILYRDEIGNQIRIEKDDAFLGTFDINYYLPLLQKEKQTSTFLAQVGAHLALPLNTFYPEVSGGLSGGVLYRQKLLPRYYIDLSGDIVLSHHSLLNPENTVNMIDREIRFSGKVNFANNIVWKKHRKLSIGLLLNYQDAYLQGYFFSRTQDEFKDLGVIYLKHGDVWEGFVVDIVPLSKLSAASMYFFSIKSFLYVSYHWGKSKLVITGAEDYPVINNAPDIQLGFQYTRSFGK